MYNNNHYNNIYKNNPNNNIYNDNNNNIITMITYTNTQSIIFSTPCSILT